MKWKNPLFTGIYCRITAQKCRVWLGYKEEIVLRFCLSSHLFYIKQVWDKELMDSGQ